MRKVFVYNQRHTLSFSVISETNQALRDLRRSWQTSSICTFGHLF